MSNQQPISTFLVAGLAGTLFVSGMAQGAFLGIALVAKEDPENPRLLICNLLINFDNPTDKLLSLYGFISPDPGLFFTTNSSNGFHQEQLFGADKDFAITAAELDSDPAMANDTYFNVGIKSGEVTDGGVPSGSSLDRSSDMPRGIHFNWNAGGNSLFSDALTGGWFIVDIVGILDQHIAGATPNGNSIFLAQLVIDTSRPTNDGGPARIDVQIPAILWQDVGGINSLAGFDPGAGGEALTASHVDCPTDTNGDGVTNVLDLIELLLCFGQVVGPPPPLCDTGQDVNGDGTVNVLDLIDLLLAFGTACP